MITMTVKSATIFDDEVRDRILYFNLEKPEIIELLTSNPKLLSTAEAMRANAAVPIDVWEFLTVLVLYSYGKRVNGDEFLKNADVRNAFKADKPYAKLMDDLLGDGDATKAIEFMTNIMPAGSLEAAREHLDAEENAERFRQGTKRPVAPQDHLPAASSRREARAFREGDVSADPNVGG